MAKKTTFLATIQREGSAGSVRGKIPAGLVKAIGAKEGDVVEFSVHGTTLVGAQVLTGKDARMAVKEKAAERPAPRSTAKPVAKGKVGKSTPKASAPVVSRKAGKKVKPAVKGSKRRTEVEYEAPPLKRKGKKFAPKLKRRS